MNDDVMRHTYVIGDIHGCYRPLRRLFDRISPEPETDTIVFLGDYIDRGPESRQVVDLVLELRREHGRVITLLGNHERMLLNFLAGHERDFYLAMGGEETLRSYGITEFTLDQALVTIPRDHLSFFHSLISYWEDEYAIYVHAGLKPGLHLTMQSPDWLLWAREKFIDCGFDFGKPVVYGHTPFKEARLEKNKHGIDTGAVYGGKLSCLVLPERQLIQVDGEAWAAG